MNAAFANRVAFSATSLRSAPRDQSVRVVAQVKHNKNPFQGCQKNLSRSLFRQQPRLIRSSAKGAKTNTEVDAEVEPIVEALQVASEQQPELKEKKEEKTEDENAEKLKELGLITGAGVLFGLGVTLLLGGEKGQEYFAGYLLEQSLSVDNLFVFILIFNYFGTTETAQNRALQYGIVGAVVTRLVMILLGAAAIEQFEPVLLIFAGILVYTSYTLLTNEEEEEEDMSENAVVQFCQKIINVSEDYDGDNFFTVQNGVKVATPLLLVVAIIEISDIVFAVDSIPAVFGVTTDPFIVYTSNIAAIASLRSLYYFVATVVAELEYLETAVAIVLGFIGSKMVFEYILGLGAAGFEVTTGFSLGVVATLLGGGVAASYLFPSEKEE